MEFEKKMEFFLSWGFLAKLSKVITSFDWLEFLCMYLDHDFGRFFGVKPFLCRMASKVCISNQNPEQKSLFILIDIHH